MKTRGPIWKVSVRTTREAEEAVTELLGTFLGQPASSYTDVETGEVTVAVYILEKKTRRAGPLKDASALKNAFQEIARCGLDIGPGKISVAKVRREDWAESWKRHFKPIEIGSALLIKPSWSKRRAKKGQAVVVLDPGLSFGTGQHPTTSFCLRQLVSSFELWVSSFRPDSKRKTPNSTRRLLTDPKLQTRNPKPSLLDIGTGSGILAIAAAKLGYAPVEAFDFDPEAVRIARENARENGASPRVNIRHRDVTKLPLRTHTRFDVICANLISNLLISERRRIVARLQKDGVLVLAGILASEFTLVQTAYEKCGMRLVAIRTEKEWRSGAFKFHDD